ncbi:hypothetical protein Btru_064923 [Bulinus truncatus]|nr:hypothetical protein Btru_064923 [Bulinus truncatus]
MPWNAVNFGLCSMTQTLIALPTMRLLSCTEKTAESMKKKWPPLSRKAGMMTKKRETKMKISQLIPC